MFITDKEIQRVVSSTRNYQIAKQYHYNDCVNEIYITYNENIHLYKIKGTVEVRGYETFAIIEVNDQSKVVDYQCDCYWSNEYAACGHIGAILLEIQDLAPETFPFHYKNDREAKRKEQLRIFKEQQKQREAALLLQQQKRKEEDARNLINQYRKNIDTALIDTIAPDTNKIYTSLINNGYYLSLKFKVGNTQKYVIKNIPSFINDILNEEVVSYGKKLSFKHTKSHFDEVSLEVLSFMTQMLSTQEQAYNTIKEIILTKNTLDSFYDMYQQVPLNYCDFRLMDYVYHPQIKIEETTDHYRISLIKETEFHLGNKHLYILDKYVLKRIVLDADGKVSSLLDELISEDDILVNKSDMEDFYTYILSDIKEYLDIEGLELSNHKEEDNIVLYGDIDEQDRICISLEYEYEDGDKKQGFDNENKDISMDARKLEGYIKQYASVNSKERMAFMSSSDKKTYNFIQLGLPHLQQYCDVYVSDALRQVGSKASLSMNVGVTIKNDLLAIDIDSVNIPKEELAAVLEAYKRKRKFYKLQDGELLYLESDTLEEIDTMLDTYNISRNDIIDGHLDLELYRAFSMDSFADSSDYITYNRSELFKETIQSFSSIEDKEYELADNYQEILRDYQKYGYQWLQTIRSYGFGSILADDMGLGKTLQVISLLDQNKDTNNVSIVICPSSLILNWEDEIHKFSPDLKCLSIYGTIDERNNKIEKYQDYDVLITSYDYIRRDIDKYHTVPFYYVILDEAQYIKNQKTKNAISVKKLQAKHKLALTGTPIENSLAELWSIFDFLMPGYLYNYHYFQTHFESPIVKEKDEQKQLELKKLISPFILRRTKKEVLLELPDKIENTIPIEFNEEERKLYLANLAKINTELQTKLDMDKIDHIAILAMLTKLRQICCEPRVAFEGIEKPSSKMQGCMDLIKNLKQNNKKVLLFSTFTSVLDLLTKELDKEGVSYYTLTGKTDKVKRRELVKKFQNDNTTVFLISLKAGGTGLNLTSAEAVIHFDPWWNISAQNQATDRAHRIGQENTVQVFKLIIKDSIEERILELQEKKKNLSDTFVEGNDGTITSMSTEDIIELFNS
ncbi:MAG: SNF2-related protein [Coprobacillaceae bacterium]